MHDECDELFFDGEGLTAVTTRTPADEVMEAEEGAQMDGADFPHGETLEKILDFVFPQEADKLRKGNFRAAFGRFLALAIIARPDFRQCSLNQLSYASGFSVASLSLLINQISDACDSHFGRKSHSARAAYRERAADVWRSKKLRERLAAKAGR